MKKISACEVPEESNKSSRVLYLKRSGTLVLHYKKNLANVHTTNPGFIKWLGWLLVKRVT
jgi:hypothetical protein